MSLLIQNTLKLAKILCNMSELSIDRFHEAIIKYGVDKVDIFQTNDLAERRDLGAVTNTMFALGRAVSKFRITYIIKCK